MPSNQGDTKVENLPLDSQATSTQQKQAFEIFKKALSYNVIAKYDPAINQLVHISSYCVVYQFDGENWNKLNYQGPMALYSRKVPEIIDGKQFSVQEVTKEDHYTYGIIILNRAKPENFTIGILGSKHLIPQDMDKAMVVERKGELVIFKDFKGETFGLWLFDNKDRDYLYKFAQYCLAN